MALPIANINFNHAIILQVAGAIDSLIYVYGYSYA